MGILGGIMVPHPPLIISEIGRGKEKEIKDTVSSYEKAVDFLKELDPETIILITPHAKSYGDYFKIYDGNTYGDFREFGASEVSFTIDYDKEFIDELSKDIKNLPGGIDGDLDDTLDHATMVPLYFINKSLKNYKIVRVALSGLSKPLHYKLGIHIQNVADRLNKKVAIVSSGDLSHRLKDDGPYGFSIEAPLYDEKIMNDMSSGNFLNLLNYDEDFLDNAGICGHRGFCIMAGTFDKKKLEIERLSYEGPFGVGYGVCTYKVVGDDENRNYYDIWIENRLNEIKEIRNNEDKYVKLARKAVEEYIKNNSVIDTNDEENVRKATFVSIHKNGELRGCIGTISPITKNISHEIISNAISAATRDNRFPKIKEDELPFLDYSVDVLEPSEITSKDKLDPKKYGIIVEKGFNRGVLLPDLDGVDTADKQLAIALKKAGLSPNEENFTIKRFEVVRHF